LREDRWSALIFYCLSNMLTWPARGVNNQGAVPAPKSIRNKSPTVLRGGPLGRESRRDCPIPGWRNARPGRLTLNAALGGGLARRTVSKDRAEPIAIGKRPAKG